MTPMLGAAIAAITTALLLYTIGVFGEQRAGVLTGRHLGFFWAGFAFDSIGTSIMGRIASADDGAGSGLHAATGGIALVLMAIHAVWASIVLARKDQRRLAQFHTFSRLVWLFWLIPYLIGMLLGIPGIRLSDAGVTVLAASLVADLALVLQVLNRPRRKGAPILGMRRENLLIVAGVVWIIAGLNVVNVVNIGLHAAAELGGAQLPAIALLLIGGLAVFTAFHAMFGRIVKKNAARIRALAGETVSPLRFLDAKGYLIMTVMMGGGIGLRAVGLIPAWFVSFFYTGLGTALILTGAGFLMHRRRGAGWTYHSFGRAQAPAA